MKLEFRSALAAALALALGAAALINGAPAAAAPADPLAERLALAPTPTHPIISASTQSEPSPAQQQEIQNTLARLPLAFEPNRGQAPQGVQFLTRTGGYLLQLSATEARLLLRGESPKELRKSHEGAPGANDNPRYAPQELRLRWRGANEAAAATAEDELSGKVNYLKGSDPANWHTAIPTYEKVRYQDLYPGIDLLYYGNGRVLEYDLIVAPGADPEAIGFAIEGAKATLTEQGDLTLALDDGRSLTLQAPLIYQERDHERAPIKGRYLLARNDSTAEISFAIADYDPTLPLVIDPLVYSTFLGGSGNDFGRAIAVNAAGEAFVTGYTTSAGFPTTAGAFDTTHNGGTYDVFVTRLNATGTALIYSTFLGGSTGSEDFGYGIAINAANEAFITGATFASGTNFPTTAGAYDTGHNGGGRDVFVTRLNATGSGLVYSTFLGGSSTDEATGIAVNSANEAFVTGLTSSADFPTTAGSYDTSHNGGGNDAFVTRLNATGTALVYSTFLGGSGVDQGYGIAVNSANEAFVTGYTTDAVTDFPTTAGSFATAHNGGLDAFVTRLNAAGTALLYSTFLGGSNDDYGYGIAVNAANEAFVTGQTASAGFPTIAGSYDTTHNSGDDAFVTRLPTPTAAQITGGASVALIYSTFLGGSGNDYGVGIAVNAAYEAFVIGVTSSAGFPTTAGAFDTGHNGGNDAFVAKLATGGDAGGDAGGPSIGVFINGLSSSEVFISDSPQGAAVQLSIEVNEIEGKELFFVLNAPALGVYWSYLNNKNQWVAVPPSNWAAIQPFRLAPPNGRHSLFGTQTLPTGTYEFYLGFDEGVDGHLNIVAGGISGKFVQGTVHVR